jgi:hypothetical protein
MLIGTKGGEPPFAAVCTKVSYAQVPDVAKSWPSSSFKGASGSKMPFVG